MEPVIVTCPQCDAEIDITSTGNSAEDGQGFFYCPPTTVGGDDGHGPV
jgi:hypothetical protein